MFETERLVQPDALSIRQCNAREQSMHALAAKEIDQGGIAIAAHSALIATARSLPDHGRPRCRFRGGGFPFFVFQGTLAIAQPRRPTGLKKHSRTARLPAPARATAREGDIWSLADDARQPPGSGGRGFSLDKIDLNILEHLQAEARITNQELARRVFLSPSACLSRVKALEAAGLITGYHAKVDIERVKTTTIVFAEVFMNRHQAADLARLDDILGRTPEIIEACRVCGPFDYILKAAVTDMREWRDILEWLLNEKYGVERVISYVLIRDVKPFTSVPVRPRRDPPGQG